MSARPTPSRRRRVALDALCRRLAPSAYTGDAADADEGGGLTRAVEARIEALEPSVARRFAVLLTLFDHPAVALLTTGRVRRFSRRTPSEQDAWLRRWQRSRIPPLRTAFQAVRRLVLSTHYGSPAAHREIGFRGPLHRREPAVGWEGPPPGEPADEEPVLRTSGGEWHAPASSDAVPPGVVRGEELRPGARITADVCVVGTGAGGAAAAARLAERGLDVVMLEEGGYWTATDFTEDEAALTPRLYADAGARATDDLSLSILQGRCVGGGTTVNWMLMLRTPDRVLEEWASDHGAEALRPARMAPVFERVEDELHARPVPHDAHSPSNRIILDGARELGWRARVAKVNARNCVRAGFCGIGCRYGAKQSALVTYVPRALACGARLYSDVRADRVEVVERGGDAPLKRVQATVLDGESGRPRGELTVEAPLVVLAAGAVGTPTILRRSGLGGRGVGRYLRVHPTTAVVGRYDREMYGSAGIPQSAVCDEFLDRGGGYGFWIECPGFLPALAAVGVPGFGEPHAEVMSDYRRLAALIVLVRDGADRDRSQGSVTVDRRGRRRIRYRMGRTERSTLADGIAAAARLHLVAGAREAITLHSPRETIRSRAELDAPARRSVRPNRVGLFSAHVNGTCRLGTDPDTSGCAPDGQVHGAPGVYVMDGSLLPTAPGVNPQETIMAVSTVLAEWLAARHG